MTPTALQTHVLEYLGGSDNVVARICFGMDVLPEQQRAMRVVERGETRKMLLEESDVIMLQFAMEDPSMHFTFCDVLMFYWAQKWDCLTYLCDTLQSRYGLVVITGWHSPLMALISARLCSKSRVQWSTSFSGENIRGFVLDKDKKKLTVFARAPSQDFFSLSTFIEMEWITEVS